MFTMYNVVYVEIYTGVYTKSRYTLAKLWAKTKFASLAYGRVA